MLCRGLRGYSMEPILRAEHLTKIFSAGSKGTFAAVRDVSFTLMRGECLGIMGESGSGKSTVAYMIARLLDPTEGRIILDGEDITDISGRRLRSVYRKLQMVFQSPVQSFDPRRTLGDGIGESLRNGGMSRAAARARTEQLLEMCGLSADYADRYPHEVSGGQCQRAAIARALAVRPRVLICDEATSSLDMTVRGEIIELLSQIRRDLGDEFSILFICHDPALVKHFCDRMLIMGNGEILQQAELSGQQDSGRQSVK